MRDELEAATAAGGGGGGEGRTVHDLLPQDFDVVVPVAARVLVQEAQRVQHLVLDDAVADAAEALKRHHLLVPDATHGGGAAGGGGSRQRRSWGGGVGVTVPRRDGWVVVLPAPGLEAQVHLLHLSVHEADAGFAVEVLQGPQDFINLVLVCSGGRGQSVAKQGSPPPPRDSATYRTSR